MALIPARRGSKSIPDKNIIKFKDRTLIRHVTQAAMESRVFSDIFITSDYPRQRLGLEDMPKHDFTRLDGIARPPNLCQDNTLMIDVVKHALSLIGNSHTFVWVFQPSSPFTDPASIIEGAKFLDEGKYDSLISFKPVSENPNRMYTIKNKRAYPLRHTNYDNKQNLMDIFIRSGNFYASKREMILENSSLENGRIGPIIFDRIQGTNIDAMEDLILAKYYVTHGHVK